MEWAIAHLENWRILATRYRSDLSRIDTDIQAVAGLQKPNEAHPERRRTFDRIKKTEIGRFQAVDASPASKSIAFSFSDGLRAPSV